MASASQDCHKELFLDILTKEEREALLTKKMEDIRKRNEALQKRHAEIEADKKRAEKTGSTAPVQPPSPREALIAPKPSPVMEDHDPRKANSNRHSQHQVQQVFHTQPPPVGKPATRSKPPTHGGAGGGGRGPKERPKSQDFRSDASYEYEPIVDIADLDSRLAIRSHSPTKHRRNPPKERPPAAFSNFDQPPNSGPPDGDHSVNHFQLDRRGPRESRSSPRVFSQTYSSRGQGRIFSEDGPPPDPVNYLSDRAREPGSVGNRQLEKSAQEGGGGGGGGRGKDTRRHPRNFGGQDFSNVQTQIKAVKEKERDRRSFPPKTRLEMTMTGSERFQYEEWKSERQKVDQERMDRQKTSSGEWRRAWDQEKNSRDFEEPPSPNRTEPARRPAGRIGSGRFDRGERDDRRADNLSQSPKGTSGMQGVVSPPPEADRKPPPGRGRGRGRGRARAQAPGGEKPPRPRTWSGGDDSRTVECTNDNGLLLVKIDKSRSTDDHSVEVEYDDDDAVAPVERRKSSPSKKRGGNRRSPVKQRSNNQPQPQLHQFQDAEVVAMTSPPLPMSVSSHDGSVDGRPASLSQSLSHCSTDEWEDVTGTDSDLYGTTEDEGENRKGVNVRLNPEAPVFQPTSPDLLKTPRSYHSSDSSGSGHASPRIPPPAARTPSAPPTPPAVETSTSKVTEPVTNGSLHPHHDEKSAEEKECPHEESVSPVVHAATGTASSTSGSMVTSAVEEEKDCPNGASPADEEDECHEEDTAANEGQAAELEGEETPHSPHGDDLGSDEDDDHFMDTEDLEVEEDFGEEADDVGAPAATSLADELSAVTGRQPPRPASPPSEGDLGIEEDDDDAYETEPLETDPALADGLQDDKQETEVSAETDCHGVGETLPDPAAVDAPEEGATSCQQAAPNTDTPQDNAQMAAVSTPSSGQAEESETVETVNVMDNAATASEETAASSTEDCAATEAPSSTPLSASEQ